MVHKLLISGDRSSFTTLAFDPNQQNLTILANHPSPFNASWVELVARGETSDCLIGLSEGDDAGFLYSFEVNHVRKTCKITSQQSTLGAPAHCTLLRDRSAIALATYYGGSVALYPTSVQDDCILLTDEPRSEILPEFSYRLTKHGPNKGRQQQSHMHQILEDRHGALYVPDLGSDRIWVFRREESRLKSIGWLQCPPGHGPRHAVLTSNERLMYVIGELSHTVAAFDLSTDTFEATMPINDFEPNVIPACIESKHQFMMDSAEICLHPRIDNVLYVSNRWARHIAEREPHLEDVPGKLPEGDCISIVILSVNGKKVESISHVQTKLDVIRGMRLSDDGKYIAVVGQLAGGIEIYSIGGTKGDEWTLVTSIDQGLESGIKHVIWLS